MWKRSFFILLLCAFHGQVLSASFTTYPALEPPRDEQPAGDTLVTPQSLPPAAAPTVEWTYHRSADLQHPNAEEQEMVWLINRARQDPTAEGIWLATETNSAVASGRSYFGVNLALLQSEFAAIAVKPPAAFDSRLYAAAKAHSDDLIARDAQDHNNQFNRISAAGFNYNSARGNVYSYASGSLNGHAAFNIDWGPEPDGMQAGRGHRKAIMSTDGDYTNVGLASVVENNPVTSVGTRVITQNFARAQANGTDHFNRFLVGTVWEDSNSNGRYDAGEGYPGVLVEPDSGTYYAVTSAGGGYTIPIETGGSYQVTFSGGGIGQSVSMNVNVGADSVLLDHELGAQPPPPTPDMYANGTVNAANFSEPVVAGSLASVFGADLATGSAFASAVPLPTTLGNATLGLSSWDAPLIYTSSGQINLQVPWELAGMSVSPGQDTVSTPSGTSPGNVQTVTLAAYSPGLFSINQTGSGQGAIQIANTTTFAAPAGSIPGALASPATKGEYITIYCIGLGPVSNQPATGAATTGGTSTTTTIPVVTIGGQPATVSFSGLAPGFVGLYQVNAQVPASAPSGNSVAVVLNIGGVDSNTVTIAIQ